MMRHIKRYIIAVLTLFICVKGVMALGPYDKPVWKVSQPSTRTINGSDEVYSQWNLAGDFFLGTSTENPTIRFYSTGTIHTDNNLVVQDSNLEISTTSGGSYGILFPDGSLQTSAGVGSANNVAGAGDITIIADSDDNGSGSIYFRIANSTYAIMNNSGVFTFEDIDWANSDDGSGSGLDADKLDGNDSTYYQVAFDTTTINAAQLNSQSGSYYTDFSNITVEQNEITSAKIEDDVTVSSLSSTGYDPGTVSDGESLYIRSGDAGGTTDNTTAGDIYIAGGSGAGGTGTQGGHIYIRGGQDEIDGDQNEGDILLQVSEDNPADGFITPLKVENTGIVKISSPTIYGNLDMKNNDILNSNLLSKSSATATYLQKSSATANYAQLSGSDLSAYAGDNITWDGTDNQFDGGGGDNLGSHTATQDLDMDFFDIKDPKVISSTDSLTFDINTGYPVGKVEWFVAGSTRAEFNQNDVRFFTTNALTVEGNYPKIDFYDNDASASYDTVTFAHQSTSFKLYENFSNTTEIIDWDMNGQTQTNKYDLTVENDLTVEGETSLSTTTISSDLSFNQDKYIKYNTDNGDVYINRQLTPLSEISSNTVDSTILSMQSLFNDFNNCNFYGTENISTYTSGPSHEEGDGAFRGATLAPNGKVIFAPIGSSNVGIYDPVDNTYTSGPAHGEGGGAFMGATLAPNGKVIFAPYGSSNVGIYDPVDNNYTSGPAHGEGDSAFRGATLAPKGKVIFVPYDSSNVGIYSTFPIDSNKVMHPVINNGI